MNTVAPKRVGMAEAQLLRAVQTLFRRTEGGALASRIRMPRAEAPRRIGPSAMEVLQSTLRKGAVGALARRGAWRRRRAWVDGAVVTGRLWSIRPELELRFTPTSFALCRYMASSSASPPPPPDSVGDSLLFYLAADALRRTELPLAELGSSPLVALGFATTQTIDWDAFVADPNALIVIEALQDDLAEHWVRMERTKAEMRNPADVLALGTAQRNVLDGFLDAIDAIGRRDLAGFLVFAGKQLLDRPARGWLALDPNAGTLSTRSEATHAGAAFLDALQRLGTWRREWAMVRFMDDGYDEAQLHLDVWDTLGQAGFERAATIADTLHSLRDL